MNKYKLEDYMPEEEFNQIDEPGDPQHVDDIPSVKLHVDDNENLAIQISAFYHGPENKKIPLLVGNKVLQDLLLKAFQVESQKMFRRVVHGVLGIPYGLPENETNKTMTNETKLWQLRAGLITESEYQESLEGVSEAVAPKTTKATDIQFILRDLLAAYGENFPYSEEFKAYTVGQIADDHANLKKAGVSESSLEELDLPAAPSSPDTKTTSADNKMGLGGKPPASTIQALGTKLRDLGNNLLKSKSLTKGGPTANMGTSEIAQLEVLLNKLLQGAGSETNTTSALRQVGTIAATKVK